MDAGLSMIMANIGTVTKDMLVIDPFVGSGKLSRHINILRGAVTSQIKCLPCLGIVGSDPTWVTTMINNMTPKLVGSKKGT